MQIRIERNDGSPIIRVQRDGPSPSEQARDALAQEYQAELQELRARARELREAGAPSNRGELAAANSRMEELAGKLAGLEEAQREQRIERAAQDMAARAVGVAGRQGTVVVSGRGAQRNPDFPPEARDVVIALIVVVGLTIVLTPLMRAFARILERRAAPPQRLAPEIESQLQRMEQAIDAVAIEVERVAEGQRFATRLLAEREKIGARN